MTSINPYFIAVLTPNPGGNSPKQVRESYDFIINKELYNITNNKQIPAYELLEKHIENLDRKIIIISEDIYLPSITTKIYSKSNILTIYVSNNPKIIDNNIIYIGIDKDLTDDTILTQLDDNLITYFTLQKIKQIGLEKILDTIQNIQQKFHLIIDLQILDQTIAPSVKRDHKQKNFLSIGMINSIIDKIKNIEHLDIIGFDDSLDDSMFRYTKLTGEVCRTIIKNIYNIKEKSMNIFTEDSRFLIYRPIKQLTNDDIGWYIVKFMTLKEREMYLQYLIDNVITVSINIDGKKLKIFVTSTSIQEQNEKSYYIAQHMFDYCLFPEEKLSMVFELLNTSKILDNNY